MKKITLAAATFLGSGYLPVAPGTWASAFTVLIAYFTPWAAAPLALKAGIIAFIFAIGIPAATASEIHFKKHDPRPCVIDEVAGQLVALFLLPRQAAWYAAAFFLFRLFDIVKPFPVRKSESLPKGLGIMTDDVLAGGYALVALLLAQRFLPL